MSQTKIELESIIRSLFAFDTNGFLIIEPVVRRRSLNPTKEQMQLIKCIHLERLFDRTSITPAMKFYGTGIGVNDWVEKPYSYLDKATYNNNFAR